MAIYAPAMQQNQPDAIYLKTQLDLARKKLQQAWDHQGKSDPSVLIAGDEFDVLLNQYQRLKQG